MRRAKKTKSSGITLTLAVLAGLTVILLGWRELKHGRIQGSLNEQLQAQSAQLVTSQSRVEQLSTKLAELGLKLEASELSVQSARDRAGNLESQRDHLRAQVDQRTERIRELESASESLEAELGRTRLSLLEAEQLPASLQGRLDSSLARIEGLETQLDGKSAECAKLPELHSWEGLSRDESVFALSGPLPDPSALPAEVYLCDANGLILEGWLARIEENMLLGHVEHLRSPVSALVKGEKVFILPRKGHEEDF